MTKKEEYIFSVDTPIGVRVTCTREYWDFIVQHKHPVLKDKVQLVIDTLKDPKEIRKSRTDENVYLFYKEDNIRFICSVVKNKKDSGFLITAYPTDKIKIGEVIWKK